MFATRPAAARALALVTMFALASSVSASGCKDGAKGDDGAETPKKKADSLADDEVSAKKKKKAADDDATSEPDKSEKADGAKKKPTARAPREPKPLDDGEKSALAKYRAALQKGRALTSKKDFAGAIAAFDEAIKAQPDDPRALSERGYAKLLAKDFKGAVTDLNDARHGTGDRKLLAQIYFNLGLAAEGRGDEEEARHAFVSSNGLNPTAAAKAKIEGKSACRAKIETTTISGETYAGWLALASAWGATYDKDVMVLEGKPTTEAAAREALCDGGCKGKGPWIATLGEAAMQSFWRIVAIDPAGDGKALVASETFENGNGGRCLWTPTITLESNGGSLLLARATGWAVASELIHFVGDEPKPCDGADDCQSACGVVGWQQQDVVFDLKRKKRVLLVDQAGDAGKSETGDKPPAVPVSVSLPASKASSRAVELKGASCDRALDFTL